MGLRTVRRRRKLTQHQLAELSGIGQSAIAMLERLRNPNPKWATVAALARALKTSPYRLFPTSQQRA